MLKRHKKIIIAGCVYLISAGCLSGLLISSAIAAGPPLPFNSFTVDHGFINADCPAAFGAATCENGVRDNGFLQRMVTVTGAGTSSGTYIQFILTEPGVTGNAAADPFTADRGNVFFTNEDFVKMGNNSGGVASSQTILESTFDTPTLENRFVYTYKYNWGWANGTFNSAPWITFHQDTSQVDYSAGMSNPLELMYDSYDVTSNGNGFNTSINRDVAQMTRGAPGTATENDIQKFRFVSRSPSLDCRNNTDPPVCDILNLPPSPALLPGGTNGGDISWGYLDEVAATWSGQSVDGPNGPQVQGTTQYDNFTTGATTSLTSFDSPDPVNWSNPFGPADTLAAVRPVVPTALPILPPDPLAATVAAGSPASGTTTPVLLPIAYNGWTVAGGVFTPTDPCIGVDCGPASLNEQGVFQRVITVGGDRYIQTIVTDSAATGDPTVADFDVNSLGFRQESFVKVNAPAGGVASTTHIADAADGKFTNNAVLKTGWAHGGPLDPILEVNQSVATPSTNPLLQSSTMWDTFYLAQGETQADKIIDINAAVGQNTPLAGLPYYMNTPIMFRTNIVEGAFQNTTHTLADDPLLPSTGGNIAWQPGDAVQATWVGAVYTTSDPAGPQIVGATSYTNLSAGDRVTNSDGVNNNNPFTNPNPDSWLTPSTTPSGPFLDPVPVWVPFIDVP